MCGWQQRKKKRKKKTQQTGIFLGMSMKLQLNAVKLAVEE